MLVCLPSLTLCLVLSATPAEKAHQQGQAALEADRFDEAIGQLHLALRLDPGHVQSHLSLAAAHLALGQESKALPHLQAYLDARPDHFLIRWHCAEVLLRLDRAGDARRQLEQFDAEVQEHPRLEQHRIACHTKLMEIAEGAGDEYAEHLHRGIGLYLLARKRGEPGDVTARRVAEELLCKAAAELTLARLRRPDEARPCLYLHGVWEQLGQRQPSSRWLRAAGRAVLPGDLTPAEVRDLRLAEDERRLGGWKK